MASFRAGGKTFAVDVNPAVAKRVRSLTGVELFGLFDARTGADTQQKLQSDLILLVDVLYAAVKPQCDAIGMTDEQFGEALADGDTVGAAGDALMEALVEFFPKARQAPLRAAIAKARERQAALTARMGQLTREIERAADEKLQRDLAKMDSLPKPGEPSTASQEQSA